MRRAMRGVHGGLPTVGAVVVGVVVGGALAGGAANLGTPLLGSRGDAGVTPRVAAARSLTALPLDFVENRGQWDPSVVFAARRGGAAAVFRTSRIDLAFSRRPSASVGLTFDGVSNDAIIVGENRRPGVYNFFVGEPERWRTRVPAYTSVRYRAVYDGVDVRVREVERDLEYDVLLAPRADLQDVVFRVTGTSGLRLRPDGSLTMLTPAGALRQAPPVSWQELPDGSRRPVDSRFRLLGDKRYGFEVNGRDPRLPLVIDPGLEWSTFLGGAGDETVEGLELAADGDVVVTGQTWSPDFAHTSGHHAPVGGTPYVARLDATGSVLVYSTFFGGSGNHGVLGMALDGSGRPVIVGDTTSEDFPTTPGAYDRTPPNGFQGDYDAFVIKFDETGSSLVFGTYLGGSPNTGPDAAWRAAHDPAGSVVVAGVTQAADFPTTAGAYDRTVSGKDVFVARLDHTGSNLTYSTLLGGDGGDEAFALAVDSQGFVSVSGKTSSVGALANAFPTTADAFDSTYDGRADGFVARLKLDGAGSADLKYATLLGGAQYTDAGNGIAFDPTDPSLVTVSGWTRSGDFPTTPGALRRDHPLPVDMPIAFVTRFRFGASNSLVWSTLYGSGSEHAADVVVNDAGEALITGATAAGDPMTTDGAYDRVPGNGVYGSADAYAARISADGARLLYGTLLGGSESDDVGRVAAWAGGNTVVIGGLTDSPDFPVTPGAFDTVYGADGTDTGGGNSPGGIADDGFVAKLTLEPEATADTTAPAAPALRGPAEGAAFEAPAWVTLDWSDVTDPSGIEAYHYQVSPNPSFKNEGGLAGTFTEAWMPTSVALVYRSQSNTGTMYWRVRALDKAHNLGPWSPVRTFTVASPEPPAQVVLESPPNNSRFAPGTVTFGWKHAARAQYYEFQLDTRSDFGAALGNGPRVWARAITTNRWTVNVAEGKWWWRVRASNQSFTDGPWSTAWAFEAKRGERLAPVPSPGTSTGGASITTGAAPFKFEPTEITVQGGGSAQVTVRLTSAAPAGGAVIPLAINDPEYASAPASVTVPAGATSAAFTVSASTGVEHTERAILSGEYAGVTQAASVSVGADAPSPELHFVTVAGASSSADRGTSGPAAVTGGTTVSGRVGFTPGWTAPAGGRVVTLTSTNPDLVQVPPSVVVPAGANFADFAVTTRAVSAPTNVVVIAARSRDFRVTVQLLPPDSLASLSLTPNPVTGGDPSTGTVTLSAPASAGGVSVALSSSNTTWATVPPSVTVPGGATSATFTVTTKPNTSGEGQFSSISATAGGVTKTVSLQVNPPLGGGGGTTADTVSITRAEYDSGARRLRVEATSTSSSAALRAYVSSTGALIGTLSNAGGGQYRGEWSWPSNPVNVTVKSSLGGSASRAVTAK